MKKFALTPGLSPAELREEADLLRLLDHVSLKTRMCMFACYYVICIGIYLNHILVFIHANSYE